MVALSRLAAEDLAQLSVLIEASVKEGAVSYVPLFVCIVDVSSFPWLREGFLVHIEFCFENTPILARLVFVLHGHLLFRDVVVLLIASVAILKYGVDGIVGSAGTVQSVSRCLLVATTSSPFSTME